MNWLDLADLILHSGRRSSFKIECDNLTDAEVAAGCALLAKVLPPFGAVAGVPRGGLRVEEAMRPFVTPRDRPETVDLPLLIVDDVWTTGGSVTAFRRKFVNGDRAHVAVLFARGPVPDDVTALFTLHKGLWSE